MGRIPKEKIILAIYVSPRCKEKLECLQNVYSLAGKRFSLSRIVEDSIDFIYGAVYLCQGSAFWKGFFSLYKLFSLEEGINSEINEVFKIIKDKKNALKEVLTVKIDLKKNFKKEVFGIGKEEE